MADITPNTGLVKSRKILDRDELSINIKRMEHRMLELDDEKERMGRNIEAARFAITTLEEEIKKL